MLGEIGALVCSLGTSATILMSEAPRRPLDAVAARLASPLPAVRVAAAWALRYN